MRIALILFCAMALWPAGPAGAEVMVFGPGSMAEALEAISAAVPPVSYPLAVVA